MMKLHSILLILASGAAYAESGSSGGVMYEVLDRLEQLQSEVQQLRGQVEEQAFSIEQLTKQQKTIYSDVDKRLQALEGGVASSSSVEQQMETGQYTDTGSIKSGENAKDTTPIQAVPVSGKAKGDEKQIYQEGYEKLRNGHYNQAIVLFKQITADFPDGQYADNAQYWLGEAYKVNQDFNSAREAFQKVITHYPDSPKVPDAMLKLGYLELEQNNIAQGRKYLTDVNLRYPGTTASNLAEERLKQLDKR